MGVQGVNKQAALKGCLLESCRPDVATMSLAHIYYIFRGRNCILIFNNESYMDDFIRLITKYRLKIMPEIFSFIKHEHNWTTVLLQITCLTLFELGGGTIWSPLLVFW